METFFKYFNLFTANYWVINWLMPLAVTVLFILLSSLAARLIFSLFSIITRKTSGKLDDEILKSFQKPFRLFIVIAGFFIAMRISPFFHDNAARWLIAVKCMRSCLVLIVAWGLYRLEDAQELIRASLVKRLDLQTNTILYPFISKALRFITVAIAILIVAQEWNYSISGLLAGLGLGGLAFALAAKDMLSNIFGGIVILVDKPFTIGDWIKTSSTEGTVEDINFRSVKVRTASQALVSVPNAGLVNEPITNFSRMGKRRVSFNMAFSLDSNPVKVKLCTEKIRGLLTHDDAVEENSPIVTLDSIDSALSLMIEYYTKTTVYKEHLEIKERIFYLILEIVVEQGLKIAYPTQTVVIENK